MKAGRAGLAFAAMTAGCVLFFAATIPLPRVDGQLVGSDGVRYYVYLPSLLLDGDLDFTDEYNYFYANQPRTAAYAVADRTPAGLPTNRFGIGPALLWSPFFLLAHMLALLLQAVGANVPTDGYGFFYQAPVLAGSIVYGGLGAWFCFRAGRRVASEDSALFATLLTVLAGNAIYYVTVEPSMSHALSMFASGAFFLAWMTERDRPGWKGSWQLGALAGLMALIRPQDGLLLALPIADAAAASWGRDRYRGLAECIVPSLSTAAAALLVFAPQFVVWKLLYGDFFLSGYQEEFGVLFDWSSPRLLPVLWSAQRGLLSWHPVFLLGLVGLWWVFRQDRGLAALSCAGFAIQWYVVSSWHDWAQGDAFGGRMFIVCTPIFVLGAAALADRVARRWPRCWMLAGGGLLVLLNFLLVLHYRRELLWAESPLTWLDLTIGRFSFLF